MKRFGICRVFKTYHVAPFTGARIETVIEDDLREFASRRPLHGGAD